MLCDRADVLFHAYALARSNGGVPGVDGIGFEEIEASGVGRFLAELRGELRAKRYGTLWKSYVRLERFLQQRVRGWLVHKHRIEGRGECRFRAEFLYTTLGLIHPLRRAAILAHALRKNLVREPDAGKPHVRFDERRVETEHGGGH